MRFNSNNPASRASLAVLAVVALAGIATAQNPACSGGAAAKPASPASQPIYISDFTVEPSAGDLPDASTPQTEMPKGTRKLVAAMTNTLVSELSRAGFTVCRPSSSLSPTKGLVLTGTFTKLEEGSSARRAFVGFGSGASHVEVRATLRDASKANDTGLIISTNRDSGKKPGAVVAPSPVVAVVKLGVTKNAPEKLVKKIARDIASQVAAQLGSS
jgi:hypothetical protein